MLINFSMTFLRGMVEKDPGLLTGTIAKVLGFIMNWIYEAIYFIAGDPNSLGLAIIFFTIVARLLMTPLSYKQQQSMFVMRKMQPEINKLQQKYSNASKDPEIQKKLAAETQKIYSKYSYNPFSGCLPLIIQLPIFFALYYIMKNAFVYIDHINDVYNQIANIVIENSAQGTELHETIRAFATELVPSKLQETFYLTNASDICKLLNKISPDQWQTIESQLPSAAQSTVAGLYAQQTAFETFFGIRVTETVGFSFTSIKILIPILSGLTTWFSSWIMTRKNTASTEQLANQQKIMNIVMPLMMAWITVQCPAGIGIYWIAGNIFMIIQQQLFNIYFDKLAEKENIKEEKK